MAGSSASESVPPKFVELEYLHQTGQGYYEWKEQVRWIKLEEDIESGSGRWCKPYIPSFSYQAMVDLKELIQDGDQLLDIKETTLDGVANRLCQSLIKNKVVSKGFMDILHATLLARHHHKHHNHHHPKRKRGESLIASVHRGYKPNIMKVDMSNVDSSCDLAEDSEKIVITLLEDSKTDLAQAPARSSSVTKFMTDGSEATTVLVANVPYAVKAVVIFVRLDKSVVLGNLNEVSLPVRFLFLIIGSDKFEMDYYQSGRAIGSLMSDDNFRKVASTCQGKSDMLSGIEQYLLKSNVVPQGKWDVNTWTHSVIKWSSFQTPKVAQLRKQSINVVDSESFPPEIDKGAQKFERSGTLFGGLIRDIARKVPYYLSDFKDAYNVRCLISVLFVSVSFLAQSITFAALLSSETKGLLGISEMIYATALCGIVFGLFSGQPLIILGATGPIFIMETSIYQLSLQIDVEFLPWRVWIGLWITLFFLIIVAFDLSFLIRYVTSGIEEIITALISMVFIYETFKYMHVILQQHYFRQEGNDMGNATEPFKALQPSHPNGGLAFMTIILIIGTYMCCHGIRKIRYTPYLSVYVRRLISDFGILIAIIIILLFDIWMEDDYTPKLDIPDYITLTSPLKRGWFIKLMGEEKRMEISYIFLAIVPAFLVTIILFIETEVTGTILDRREHKLLKGSGYSLDLLIIGILVAICSIFGLPWMCGCQVHSILHLNSLSVLSKNHAPGTRAHIVKVVEQRFTSIVINILIGLSIFLAPVLRLIPIAVIIGVFLYLGVTPLTHLQMTERVKLIFIPAKRHPNHQYLQKVKTIKVHLFTLIQLLCLAIVFIVKNSIIAPSFPFFILMLIPSKILLRKAFSEEELEELDGVEEDDINDDLDEYDVVPVKT